MSPMTAPTGRTPMSTADAQIAEIRAILAAFDWERDDRQLALEAIERIVQGPSPETEDARDAECSYCTTHITLIDSEWWADDGTLACTDTSAPYVPHRPVEG